MDGRGVRHRCGLGTEARDPTMVHVHVCFLPYRRFPLGPVQRCGYDWMDGEPVRASDRLSILLGGEHWPYVIFEEPPPRTD